MIRLRGSALALGSLYIKHDAPKSSGTDWDLDGGTSVDDLLSSDETGGGVHGNGSDGVLTQVLGDLEDELSLGSATLELDLEGVQDRGQVLGVEVDIDDGTNDGLDGTDLVGSGGSVGSDGGDWRRGQLRMPRCPIGPRPQRHVLPPSFLRSLQSSLELLVQPSLLLSLRDYWTERLTRCGGHLDLAGLGPGLRQKVGSLSSGRVEKGSVGPGSSHGLTASPGETDGGAGDESHV